MITYKKRNKNYNNYLSIGHNIDIEDVILWFIDNDYNFHFTNQKSLAKYSSLKDESKLNHYFWAKYNEYDFNDRILSQGRHVKKDKVTSYIFTYSTILNHKLYEDIRGTRRNSLKLKIEYILEKNFKDTNIYYFGD